MTSDQARDITVANELALADECLSEARHALEGGFHRLVRSRAYYAVFHAATAFFTRGDQAFRKHTALLAAIDTQLVRPGRIPPESASLIRGLYQSRLKSDYGDSSPVSKSDAEQAIATAEKIVGLLRSLPSEAERGA